MPGLKEVRAIGPSAALTDRKAGVQRSVNLYLSKSESLGEDPQLILASTPGLETFADITGTTIRGSYYTGERWFVAADDTLYEVMSDGTYTSRGTLTTLVGFVSMRHGRDQLVIVDGSAGYVMGLNTNTFTQITDPDWLGSDYVEELDGYFIFVDPGTDQFYLSAIDDASALDALDFSSADAQQDDILTHRVLKRELFLFGSRSVEIWVNSGGADFPFVRYNSTPIDVGIIGKRALAFADDTLIWVGATERGDGYVYELQGHQPVRVSTKAVEEALATSSDLTLATMWSYRIEGAEFVGLNAPGMATTWVFNCATREWCEMGELVNGEWTPMRGDFHTFAFGEHYCADGDMLYRIGPELNGIDAEPLVRERTWPHLVSPSMETVNYAGIEIGCTTGNGGTITLEISNDGGYVYGSPLQKSLGATGRRMQRIRWLMLGSANDRVFRLRCTDAVGFNIHRATVDAS